MRKPVSLAMTIKDIILLMSEGNPGAINVMMMIQQQDPADALILLDLDDMNIRGSQIWVAYKDWAKGDIKKLISGARDRDPEMVNYVRDQAGNCGGHVAVTSGASRKRPPMMNEVESVPTRFESESREW